MPLVVRSARADELARAEELVVRSINDLTGRHGFGQIAASRSPDFQAFCLREDPRGVWLAQDDGEIAGFALSWVCDQLWFLAELFVAPGRQGQGIGNELLDRTLRHATQAGGDREVPDHLRIQRRVPGSVRAARLASARAPPLVQRRARVVGASRAGHTLRIRPIRTTDADLEMLRRLDLAALGVSREKHHRYLLGDPKMEGVFLEDGGECMGYAYVGATGHVGPLAVMRAHAMPAAFRTALAIAVAGEASQISVFVPGPSHALAIAADQGMRLTLPMMLMSERIFGDWTRYLPRTPGFM